MLKDNLQQTNYARQLGEICEICKYNHDFIKCPFVFLQLNKYKIRKSYNKMIFDNERKI